MYNVIVDHIFFVFFGTIYSYSFFRKRSLFSVSFSFRNKVFEKQSFSLSFLSWPSRQANKLIKQRTQEVRVLNQFDEGDDGGDDGDALQGGAEGGAMPGQGPPGTVTITITLSPQDQQAINRVLSHVFFSRNFHRLF
jgi:hypothetical protein